MGGESDTPGFTRLTDGVPVNYNEDALRQARQILGLTVDGRARKASAIADQTKALIGEVIANDWVTANYRGHAKRVADIRRANGVPVFDHLYRTGKHEFVLVEAKASEAKLGFTTGTTYIAAPTGEISVLELPRDVEQLSGRWLEQRLAELRGLGPEGQALARELERSWRTGRLRVVSVRAPLDPRTTELAYEVVDYTDSVNAHVGATARHRTPPVSQIGARTSGTTVERGVARSSRRTPQRRAAVTQRRLAEADLDAALAATRAKRTALTRIEGRVKTARGRLDKARAAGATAPKAAARQADAERKLRALEAEAQRLRRELADGERAEATLRARLAALSPDTTAVSAGAPTAPARGLPADAPPPTAGRAAAIDAEHAAQAARVERDAAEALRWERGTRATQALTRDVTVGSRLLREERVASSAAKVAVEAGRAARMLTLTKNVGRVALAFFVPLSLLEIALQLAIWLLEWDQARRRAPEEERVRLESYLFGVADPIEVPFAQRYFPTAGRTVWSVVNSKLTDPQDPQNVVYWLKLWDSDERWLGFVYTNVRTNLIRQEHDTSWGSTRTAVPLRYYAGQIKAQFVVHSSARAHESDVVSRRALAYNDPENLFTLGSAGDPGFDNLELRNEYLTLNVQSQWLQVSRTCPTPTLTPFHYVIFKTRELLSEVIRFISRFDENLMLMEPFTEDTFFTTNWYEGVEFSAPIDSASAHYCLKFLQELVELLETHGPRDGESSEAGYQRRVQIVLRLVGPNRTRRISQVATRLYGLASNVSYTDYRPEQDPELSYLDNEYLRRLALGIEADLVRMSKDMALGDNEARKAAYKYLGS
jgi:hypothetical protein